MMNTKESYITGYHSSFLSGIWIFFIDFFLFNISYFLCNYFKRGTFDLSANYTKLLVLFYICWFVASFTGKKFEEESFLTFRTDVRCFGKSALYMAYCIAFAVVILGISGFSRIQRIFPLFKHSKQT